MKEEEDTRVGPKDRVGTYTMEIAVGPEEARESKSGELIVARAAADARVLRSAGLICEPHVCASSFFLTLLPLGTLYLSMVRGSKDSGAP